MENDIDLKEHVRDLALMENDIDLKEHVRDLEEFLFQSITIRRTFYEKLEKISSLTDKTVEQTLENMIDHLFIFLKKAGDL